MNKPQKQNQQPKQNVFIQKSYQGLLPSPEMMHGYSQLDPSFPDRIIKLAEEEAKNRHNNETRVNKGFIRSTYLGIISAFLSVIIVGAIVVYAFYLGFPTQAAAIATGVIVSLAAVFMYSRKRK